MANVFDVARFILEEKGCMSTMKLQKLCYYSQAWSLVWDDNELFPEEFEAWANGPVCVELFHATKGKFSVSAEDEPGNSNHLTENQKDTVQKVLDYYYPHDAQWLSELTHMEDPWKNARARAGVPFGAICNEIITKEDMSLYYGGLA